MYMYNFAIENLGFFLTCTISATSIQSVGRAMEAQKYFFKYGLQPSMLDAKASK